MTMIVDRCEVVVYVRDVDGSRVLGEQVSRPVMVFGVDGLRALASKLEEEVEGGVPIDVR